MEHIFKFMAVVFVVAVIITHPFISIAVVAGGVLVTQSLKEIGSGSTVTKKR